MGACVAAAGVPSTAQRITPWCGNCCWSSGARSRSPDVGPVERTTDQPQTTTGTFAATGAPEVCSGRSCGRATSAGSTTTDWRRRAGTGKADDRRSPRSVEARQELGHYEGDTVHGASWEKTCVVTLVERATAMSRWGSHPTRR